VIAGLATSLGDEYMLVRRNAVHALGQLGAAAISVLPQIERMSDDPNRAIQLAVVEATRRIREARP
jgi:HEAT repeat protein